MLAPFVAILLGKDWYLGVLPALAAGAVLGWIGADGAAGTMLLFAAIGACLILAGLVGKSGLPRVETK